MNEYIEAIKKFGLVGSDEGLSLTGKILSSEAKIYIDQARHQVKAIKKDKARSPLEIAKFAKAEGGRFNSRISKTVLGTGAKLQDAQIALDKEREAALSTTLNESTLAIYALELSKKAVTDKSKILTDKTALAALAQAPSIITGISRETISKAQESYINKHHPDISERQAAIEKDKRLLKTIADVADSLNDDYAKFENNQDLENMAQPID